jgi:hypothetical protein
MRLPAASRPPGSKGFSGAGQRTMLASAPRCSPWQSWQVLPSSFAWVALLLLDALGERLVALEAQVVLEAAAAADVALGALLAHVEPGRGVGGREPTRGDHVRGRRLREEDERRDPEQDQDGEHDQARAT